MEQAEKVYRVKIITGETDDDIISVYLDRAKSAILHKAYPFCFDKVKDVPFKYNNLQIEIAVYLMNKRGAEGELSHSENGISRSYESASVPKSMLAEVTPFCGIVGGDN